MPNTFVIGCINRLYDYWGIGLWQSKQTIAVLFSVITNPCLFMNINTLQYSITLLYLHDLWIRWATTRRADQVDGVTLSGSGCLWVESGAARWDEDGEVDSGGVQVRPSTCLLKATLEHSIISLISGMTDGQVIPAFTCVQVHPEGKVISF